MSKCFVRFQIVLLILAVVVVWITYGIFKIPEMEELDPNPYWGKGQRKPESTKIKEFQIKIPDKDIEDLNRRLNLPLILTPILEDSNCTYGNTADAIEKLVDYWKNKYNWRERESYLNSFKHFKTVIDGLEIYFIRMKPKNVPSNIKVRPLLLLHGWPGSFVEYLDMIPKLITPNHESNTVFEVICPTLPGFGFSEGSAKLGFSVPYIGQIFHKLMKRLDHEKYYIHAGDWGSVTATAMTTCYQDSILGFHTNFAMVLTPLSTIKYLLGSVFPSIFSDSRIHEKMYPISKYFEFAMKTSGYFHLQATRPDTIGASFNESPVSLASYLIEKFFGGTYMFEISNEPDMGLFLGRMPLDRVLDIINIYWFTQSITPSMRIYADNSAYRKSGIARTPTDVPMAFSGFPNELILHPENVLKEKFRNIVQYKIHMKGGHFAQLESPEILVKDFLSFVKIVEDASSSKTEL